MPSKKLPNRVESLFDTARAVTKDGHPENRPPEPRLTHPVSLPPSEEAHPLDTPQAMAGWTWETDSTGGVVFCSPEVETVLGFTPQEMRGRALNGLASAANGNGAQALADAMRAARPFADLRLRAQRRDGRAVILVSTGYPIRDETGRLVGYHGVTYVSAPPLTAEFPPSPAPSQAQAMPVVAEPLAALPPLAPTEPPAPLETTRVEPPAHSAEAPVLVESLATLEPQASVEQPTLVETPAGVETLAALEPQAPIEPPAPLETPRVEPPAPPAETPILAEPLAALEPQVPAERPAPVEAPATAPLPEVAPAEPLPPARLPVEPLPLASAPRPIVSTAWGYLDGPEGLAPLEEDFVLPGISEAISRGQLIHKTSELPTREGEAPQTGRSLTAPIKLQNQILGALDFFDMDHSQSWSEDDVALAQTVADQLALALENARLFNETRIQQRNATFLARATQAVARTLSETELWNVLADELVVAYHPFSVAISHWEPATSTLTPLALRGAGDLEIGVGTPLSDRPGELYRAIQSGQGLLLRHAPLAQGVYLASMAQPLLYNDNLECLVEVTTDRAEEFTPDDLKLLGSILFAAASALRTVRLYDLQRQTAERLTELDRVKSQFLANMSHELRTPLNSIIGFSRVILKGIDGPLTEQQAQDLTSIYNSGRHLLELINDILDMSKIEAGKMEMSFEEVDLHDIIRGVMSTAVGLVKDKPAIQLKEDLADPLPTVSADATRIRQVMINLMSNAAKFTEAGSICLRARTVEEHDPLTDHLARYVQISVVDTGTGIAEKDMHKLFEAFSQVDSSPTRKVGGTGLGLSICRRMIDLHGGRIWAESREGQGSTFSFTLPLYQKEAPPPAADEGRPAAPTVLVVEDDQGLVGLYRRYLEPHGYAVVAVDKSTDTLSSTVAYQPVAILLDVIMPNQDGWQVLTDLKSNEATRLIPVIICTIVSDRERAMSLGAAEYLNKPILEADLLHALEKTLSPAGRPTPAPAGAA
jgi:PAS domain S-box-containing protein